MANHITKARKPRISAGSGRGKLCQVRAVSVTRQLELSGEKNLRQVQKNLIKSLHSLAERFILAIGNELRGVGQMFCMTWDGTKQTINRLEAAGYTIVAYYGLLIQVTVKDSPK